MAKSKESKTKEVKEVEAVESVKELQTTFSEDELDAPCMENTIVENVVDDESITYTVKRGDTLRGIASKYGMYWKELYAKNKFVIGNNPDLIKAGQVLKIK